MAIPQAAPVTAKASASVVVHASVAAATATPATNEARDAFKKEDLTGGRQSNRDRADREGSWQ